MRKIVFCRVLLTAICVLALTASYAQNKTITGVISDQNGIPLEKATVQVKGGKVIAVTDNNGHFELVVPANARAVTVTYVGMKPQDIVIFT